MFAPNERKKISKLRKMSINRAYKTLKPNNISNSNSDLIDSPTNNKVKKSRRKRGAKRKGARKSKTRN